jgi:hypothetical protein
MRRVLSEWGFILLAGAFLALSAFWAGSYYLGGSTSHLRIPTTHSVGDNLHVVAGDGSMYLFDQFESDASGNVRPMVVDLKTHIAPKVRRIGRCTIPGLDLRYCQFDPDGYVVWSLRLSLLYPAIVALVGAILCHRLGRLESKRRISPAPEESRR